jgi:hypothetical protein
MTAGTPGGDGGSQSATVSARFPNASLVTAQAAVGAFGLGDEGMIGEVGFTGYVANGNYNPLGNEAYGTWAHVFLANNVTQIDFTARSYSGYVIGSALVNLWA